MNNPHNPLTGKIRTLAEQFKEDGFWPYCRRAFAWAAFLMIMSFVSPNLPPFMIPVVLLVYALFSTCGALYPIIINRKHRQFKLVEEGRLSRINRRWIVSLIISFVVALASGFLFLLQSPTWDILEWFLLWLAVPAFFILFEGAKSKLSKEFKPWYLKATAMKLSFLIIVIVLSVIYAITTTMSQPPAQDSGSFTDILNAAYASDYFTNAQTALLSEASYIAITVNVMGSLGVMALSQSLGGIQVIAWIINFIACASILLGLISQYGCCLLTRKEIESEFRLLPDSERENDEPPYVKRYFVILGALALATCVTFGVAEYYLEKAGASGEISPIKQWIEDRESEIAPVADAGLGRAGEALQAIDENNANSAELLDEINEQREKLISELTGQINEYYNGCLDKVDTYVDLYYNRNESLFDIIWRFLGAKAAETAIDQFRSTVVDSEQASELEENYAHQRDAIKDKLQDLVTMIHFGKISHRDAESRANEQSGSETLNLWLDLDSTDSAENHLTPRDGESKDEFKNRLTEMIEANRRNAVEAIEDSFQSPLDAQSLLDTAQ